MQDQTTNSLQQPRSDVQQGAAQTQQTTSSPGASDQVSPLLSEPAPQEDLQVQQSVGSPDSSIIQAPLPGGGLGLSGLILAVIIVIIAAYYLPKALRSIDVSAVEPETPPSKPKKSQAAAKPKAKTKSKTAGKKSASKTKRKKSTKR